MSVVIIDRATLVCHQQEQKAALMRDVNGNWSA